MQGDRKRAATLFDSASKRGATKRKKAPPRTSLHVAPGKLSSQGGLVADPDRRMAPAELGAQRGGGLAGNHQVDGQLKRIGAALVSYDSFASIYPRHWLSGEGRAEPTKCRP